MGQDQAMSLIEIDTQRQFVFKSKDLLKQGRKLFPGKPYRLITDLGELIFLPIDLCDEVKNDPRFSFGTAFGRVRILPWLRIRLGY